MKKHWNKKQIHPNNATHVYEQAAETDENAPVLEDRIRQRAYGIHQARGGTPGQDLDDWLQAEREIKAERDQTLGTQT